MSETPTSEEPTSETPISKEEISVNENQDVATNSNIVDTEENKNKATPSGIEEVIDRSEEENEEDSISTPSEVEEVIVKEEVEDIVVATESEIFDVKVASLSEITSFESTINVEEENLFGSGGQELFTMDVSSSTFTLKAVTKRAQEVVKHV